MKNFEINGITYEFDEKLLQKTELRVGEHVQLLKKEYSNYKLYPAIITQILPFNDGKVPAVEVLYVDTSYNSCKVCKTVLTNTDDDERMHIIKNVANSFDTVGLKTCIEYLDEDVLKKQHDYESAKKSREQFIKFCDEYFSKEED